MLRFGPGGVPLSTKNATIEGKKLDARQSGILRLKELKLNHMEVEFVYGVNITEENAAALGKLAKQKDITLTVHAPYYINLASTEKAKYHASISRIEKTIWAADLMGAKSVTFHPAFYQKQSTEEVFEIVTQAIIEIIQKSNPKCLISLETTGKQSQFGTVEELIKVAHTVNEKFMNFKCSICVDFTHIFARSNGKTNSYEDFDRILKDIKSGLGAEALKHLHIHTSGINYTEKGERNHLNLAESKFDYRSLLRALRDNKVSGWVVCESPSLEEDAMLMKDTYSKD